MKIKLNKLTIVAGACFLFLIAFIVAGMLLLDGLEDFDLSEHQQQEITFQTDMAELSGSLILPSNNRSAPILLFVHGDGPQDRFSAGGYLPLMSGLLDHGIGVFSWDKAGIGESSGDWLQQSMADRAAEAMAALAAIQTATASSGNPVGFIGFSQAGWVLPKVAVQLSPNSYFITIGGATNWQMQGAYFATVRLKAAGQTDEYIQTYVQEQIKQDKTLFAAPANYDRYVTTTSEETPHERSPLLLCRSELSC